MNNHYDIIIIGSGGGTKIAIPAAQQGLQVALIEEDDFGGTCLNRGCIPSKMLIHPAEVVDMVRYGSKMGIEVNGNIDLRFHDIIQRIIHEIGDISSTNRQRHANFPGLTLYTGHGEFTNNKTITVNGETLTADKIIIATGSRPSIPDIEGLKDTPYITSREALKMDHVPRKMLVLGAGYIAVELGGAYSSYGSDVHFLVRSRFLRGLDTDISDEFERVFSRHQTVHRPFCPDHVSHNGTTFTVSATGPSGASQSLNGDCLLVATGVIPNTDNLGLANTNIAITADHYIEADACLRTTVPDVYAIGDCVGNYLFRHTVNYEGEYLMRTLWDQNPEPIDYGPVPYAVFTTPQIAGVGMTEEQTQILGLDAIVGKATYADSTPGMARAADHGFAKVIFDRDSRRLIGAHIIGEEAASMIHLFVAMMKMKGTLDDLLDMIFVHPALPEVARDAVRNARERAKA